jgi:hypothetical protein
MANRTLQFYGYAYGTTPVQLNAHINGEVVFSGTVPTTDQPLPIGDYPDMSEAPVLFTVADSALVSTEFEGSLPMTVSIATGDGIALGEIFCNYMISEESQWTCQTANSTIAGDVWTVGTVTEGSASAIAVGQLVLGSIVPFNYDFYVKSGNEDGTWVLNRNTTLPPTTATGDVGASTYTVYPGNVTAFSNCYEGIPTNSDNSADPRSSVTIDAVAQNPARDGDDGTWTWVVPQGSTIAYNLNISLGNVA